MGGSRSFERVGKGFRQSFMNIFPIATLLLWIIMKENWGKLSCNIKMSPFYHQSEVTPNKE